MVIEASAGRLRERRGRNPEPPPYRCGRRGVCSVERCDGDVRRDKRFRLACTVGLRVFVCHNLAFRGDYTPVLAKHSKRFSLEDALSIGVDRMQRNFDPMRQQVERWRAQQLSAEAAKLTIYGAFIEGDLEVPKHLARRVHELSFNPQHEEFEPRTTWSGIGSSSLNAAVNAFDRLSSGLKLIIISKERSADTATYAQNRSTAKRQLQYLGGFLEARFSGSFYPDSVH